MRWLAVAVLIPIGAGCLWVASTLVTLATASCCSGISYWQSAPGGTKLLLLGLVLWHAAGAVVAAVAALGLAVRAIRR